MSDEFYIGVGCLEPQWLPFAVLRHSVIRHTQRSVRVEPLYQAGIEIPVPIDPKNRQKTPFSFQRFLIPEVRGYRGRAIYLDSDMLVFQNIADVFGADFGDANVLAVPHETSVLVLDCDKLTWNVRQLVEQMDACRLSYDGLMTGRSVARVGYTLPRIWNWLDNSPGPIPRDVALLHYTVTSNQPWLTTGHPQGYLWLAELFAALDDRAIRRDEVEQAVQDGFVRPSLLFQIDHRVVAKSDLPASVIEGDRPFAEFCRYVQYSIVKGCPRQCDSA